MSVDLSVEPEVERLLREVREWSVNEVRPLARRADAAGVYPAGADADRVIAACPVDVCPMGFEEADETGNYNADFGGLLKTGPNVLGVRVMEEMGYGDGWAWQVLPGGRLGERIIRKVGTQAQIERWVGPVDRGEYTMSAIAMTEEVAGSDVAGMQMRAERDGDWWVLNGTKRFISNGGLADFILVFATLDPAMRHHGIRAFMVEKETPGFTVTRTENKIGFRFAPQAELRFENVRIPLDQCLGDPEQGGRDTATALSEFNATRPYCVAWATGSARGALDVATEWVDEHSDEYSADRLAQIRRDTTRMRAALDDARRLILNAAWQRDQGRSNIKESSMAKSLVAPIAERVVLRSLQMVGPEAASERHLLEKWYRDIKLFDIVEGTGQILRITISRQQLGPGAARS
jgi:alkylation response protein AidB-like acyl-CoA dehydrogenase